MAQDDYEIKIRTTADTAGIQQTSAQLRQLEAQTKQQTSDAEAAGRIGGRLVGQLLGGLSVFAIIDMVKNLSAEFAKVAAESEKIGAQLVRNAQKYAEEAKAAETQADVIKIGHSALRDVEAAHERINTVQKERLGIAQEIQDSITHNLIVAMTAAQVDEETGRFNQQLLDQKRQQAAQDLEIARQVAAGAIRTSEAYKEAFDRRKAQPINEVIQELIKHVADLEIQLKGIDYNQFPESWLKTAQNIELAKKQLQEFISIQQRGLTAGPGGGSVIAGPAPPRTVAEWRADQARATAEFERTMGPQGIADWRARQEKAMAEFQGQTPRFGGSSANDILTALKDANTLLRQQIDLWK
jgi:hypothetical protein